MGAQISWTLCSGLDQNKDENQGMQIISSELGAS